MASAVLSPLPDEIVVEEVTPLPDLLATWGASWNQVSGQYWALYTTYGIVTIIHITAFDPLTNMPMIEDRTKASAQLTKLQSFSTGCPG